MSLEDGLYEKKKFDPKECVPDAGKKTQRSLKSGNIGSKRGGATKK